MSNVYVQGFIDKCAEAGIDPEALVKVAARGDMLAKQLLRVGKLLPNQGTVAPTMKSLSAAAVEGAEKGGPLQKSLAAQSNRLRNLEKIPEFGSIYEQAAKSTGNSELGHRDVAGMIAAILTGRKAPQAQVHSVLGYPSLLRNVSNVRRIVLPNPKQRLDYV